MTHVTSMWQRATHSARGELFNSLIYPFLLTTLSYGIGFVIFKHTDAVSKSSLFEAMHNISPFLTDIWGILAILVIFVSLYALIFDRPPVGKVNCFIGFLLWFFAAVIYVLSGGILTLFSVAIPNLFFWTWHYFSLARFRREVKQDNATIAQYRAGEYGRDEPTRQ